MEALTFGIFVRRPWKLRAFSSTYTPVYVVCLINVQGLEIIEARLCSSVNIAGLGRLGHHALDCTDVFKLLSLG